MKWLPIETAPRDGTNILVISNGDVSVVHFLMQKQNSTYGDFGTEYRIVPDPTHWMPLPDPPEKENNK